MSFNPPPGSPGGNPYSKERMAKWEIKYRFGVIQAAWWRFMPGTEITVKWPRGWAVLDEDSSGGQTAVESTDPNDHYRPWLEKHVGRQGWDWDWKLGPIAANNSDGTVVGFDTLVLKFRRKHQATATAFLLKWG